MNPCEKINDLQQCLSYIDDKLKLLAAELELANAKLKEDLAPELKALKARRRSVEESIAEFRLREAQSWKDDDLRVGIFNIFDDIGKRLDQLFTRVRS